MGELASGSAFPLDSGAQRKNILTTARGASILLGGKLFMYGARFVMFVLIARLLGAEQYGLYNLALTAATIAGSVGVLGLDAALVRYVAVYRSRGDEARLWGTLQLGAIGGGLVASSAAWSSS